MKKQTLYKLTDAQGQTHGDGTVNIQWGVGVTHDATGPEDGPLCSASWIHAYEHPLIAVLLNPIHADLENPQLWSCRGKIGKRDGQLKCGCRTLTSVARIPLPRVVIEHRVRFAIGCAWPQAAPDWKTWATGWLSGKDRTAQAAEAAGAAGAARAAEAAGAAGAVWAARAAEAPGIDLICIAQWALTDDPIESLYPADVVKESK